MNTGNKIPIKENVMALQFIVRDIYFAKKNYFLRQNIMQPLIQVSMLANEHILRNISFCYYRDYDVKQFK